MHVCVYMLGEVRMLMSMVQLFRPRLLIAGGSAYPREWDYARMVSERRSDDTGAVDTFVCVRVRVFVCVCT